MEQNGLFLRLLVVRKLHISQHQHIPSVSALENS